MSTPNYWIYAPGEQASYWDEFHELGIMGLGWDNLGDINSFKTKDDLVQILQDKYPSTGYPRNAVLANWEFKNSISIGDIIFVKKGVRQFVGWGVVESDYYYDTERSYYKSCRKVKWMNKGVWEVSYTIVPKTLTNITKYNGYPNKLLNLLGTGLKEEVKNIDTSMSSRAPSSNFQIEIEGEIINCGSAKDNFVEFVRRVVQRVGSSQFLADFPHFSKVNIEDYPIYKRAPSEFVDNFYLDTHSSTKVKLQYIEQILRKYNLIGSVKIIENYSSDDLIINDKINDIINDVDDFIRDEVEKRVFLYSVTDRSLGWKKLNVYKDTVDLQLVYELVDCEEFTYIISDKGDDFVKIGKTKNDPEVRLSQLRTGNPSISLIHTFPSTLYSEKELHIKFDDLTKDLEWFHYTKKLKNFISEQKETHIKIMDSYRKRLQLDESEREILNCLG